MHIVPGDPLARHRFVLEHPPAAGGILALQSNPQPDGGMTATQSIPPPITPADIEALVEQLTPPVAKFREQSAPQKVALDSQSLNLGDSKGIRIASVGLGVRVITHWSVVYSFINALAGAQVINFSNVFPFNHLKQTLIQINGGAQVYAADGLANLAGDSVGGSLGQGRA